MAKFLLATWEGGGVMPPELGLARRLIARGHAVRVLADPVVEPAARAAGCDFSAWSRAPHRRSLAVEEEFLRDWEYRTPFGALGNVIDACMCGPAALFAADTLAVLDQHPVDAMLVDFMVLGAGIAAESRQLPYATLMPNIYLRPAPGLPAFGPGLAPARGPLGRLRDRLLNAAGRLIWRRGLPPVNRARADLGLGPLPEIFAQHDRAQRVLVMTARAFDFEASELPPNVRYVGPILDDPAWAGADFVLPWPADNRDPLVLVSLSSTPQGQVGVLQRVVDALCDMPVRAVVTLGPALQADAVRSRAANVVCVAKAPHTALLREASAVISHCGHGTAIKALAAGVPLVCMPMGRDQNENAARISERGAGLRIRPGASIAAIRSALQRVLSEPRFAQGARALREAMAREADAEDVVAEVENMLQAPAHKAASRDGDAAAAP